LREEQLTIPRHARWRRHLGRSHVCVVVALAAFCLIAGSPAAFAHVKWFAQFDVAEQPVLLEQAISGALCKLGRDRPIVAVCRAGSRSAQATVILREAGFTEVVNLTGGMLRWRVEDHGAEGGSA
jgi:rhodanese-related sulfurtransferase